MNLQKIADVFQLKESEKNIIEKLIYSKELSATKLARETGLSRTSIYDFIGNLKNKHLIKESSESGKKKFSLENIYDIEMLLEEQEDSIKDAKQTLAEITLLQKNGTRKNPRLKMFTGRRELRIMMNDMLEHEGHQVYSFWPIKDVSSLLGKEFFEHFHLKRKNRKIAVNMILPYELGKDANKYIPKKHFDFIKVKRAPKNVNFSLGYTVYGDTVRFISSEKENYGFLIVSDELVEMMRSQFELIWELSSDFKIK